MALSLEEAISRVPPWAGADKVHATPLSGGITNTNFRIDVDGKSFVLRITGEDTELLGINREYEYIANREAGKLGIAPEVYFFIKPEGYLVTRFIDGKQILPEEMCQKENIRLVMESVKKIHGMHAIPGNFNVFNVIRSYVKTARRYHVSIPKNYDFLIKYINEAEITLLSQPYSPCPCHNDLLNANFLANSHIYILDWEYAGMGDIFFDLANFSDHHNFSEEQDQWMLEYYFGEINEYPMVTFNDHENIVRSTRSNLGLCTNRYIKTGF